MTTNEGSTVYQPSIHPLAIISLVLSITGMLPILPVIGSIAGIVTGIFARREIRDHPDQYTGDGMAKAGIILGIIGIVLAVCAVCGLLLFLVPVRTVMTNGPMMQITGIP